MKLNMIKRDKHLSENVFKCPIHVKCLFETNEPKKTRILLGMIKLEINRVSKLLAK